MVYLETGALLISFLVVFFLTPFFIKYVRSLNLLVKDQNKLEKPLVPISGGLVVLFGFLIAILLYVFFSLFIIEGEVSLINNLSYLFAGLTSLIMITIIGFLDDLIIDKNRDASNGYNRWYKPFLTLIAAIPLMAVAAGDHIMNLPFVGLVDFGLIYPLVLIPLGVIGASNMVNILEGYNGLGVGMGIVYTGMLGIYAFLSGSSLAGLISLLMCASLLAFFFYNKVPAKILPGDSLTYLLGGTIAVVAILGDMERAAIIASIPFFIEFILKIKGRVNKHSFGYEENGKIKNIYGKKIYSLPHILTRTGRFTERQIVWIFMGIELVFCLLMWVL